MTITVIKKQSGVRCGRFILLLTVFFSLIAGLENPAAAENLAERNLHLPIPVFVSVGAHLDFCREIGGSRVLVKLALPPGKSPATYAPTPQQIQDLSQARLFFRVGLPFETALLNKLKALPHSPEIIDTQIGIKLQPLPGEHRKHRHQGLGLDPHTWLDPELARQQAATICRTLSRIDPEGENIYNNNFILLETRLKVIDKELKESFTPFRGRTIFVYHPAFGYFARACGLKQVAIELAGKTPKARELAIFMKRARAEKIAALFVQPQFDRQSAEKIAAALGCAVIKIDPLAVNYCDNLRYIATTIQAHIQAKP